MYLKKLGEPKSDIMELSKLKIGKTARVVELEGGHGLKRKKGLAKKKREKVLLKQSLKRKRYRFFQNP